jgi:Heterokaryon incompatibility protein (HET)
MTRILPYEYPPLEGHMVIRTVQLLPRSGDNLECILGSGRLDQLEYQCLSYVWGRPQKPYRIVVRDKDSHKIVGFIPLTLNLYHALSDLLDSDAVTSKTFWIDQISIHQENFDEKGSQVALMGDIYRYATAVIMYLGPTAPHDDQGIDLITLLYNHFEPSLPPIFDMTWYMAQRRSVALPVEHLPESVTPSHPGWAGLLDIVFGAWIERTWIVQENVLNDTTFMLRGQRAMNWIAVAAIPVLFGVELLPLNLLDDIRATKNSSLDCYIDAVCRSLEIRYRKAAPTRLLPLPTDSEGFLTFGENLEWYDALDCSDPRDHIYSILSLSTDRHQLGIVPNYGHSVPRVFIDATVRMLKTYKSIRNFHYVSLLDNLSESAYPSWSLTPTLLGRQHFLDHNLYAPHPVRFAGFSFDEETVELTAKGRVIDWIDFAAPCAEFVQGSTFWGITELENAQRLVFELLAYASVLEYVGMTLDGVNKLLISIIAEKFRAPSDGLDVRGDPVHSFWCYLRYVWADIDNQRRNLRRDAREALPPIEKMIADVAKLAGKEDKPDLTEAEVRLGNLIQSQKITYGRCFGVTERNRIVNFTFKAAVGDSIALLQAGRCPFVLRPVGETFQYVGDVCVPGIMYGEAYDGLDPEKVDHAVRLV